MTFNNMNICEFIEYIITFNNIDAILDTCKTQSEKGFIYERLWDICIKLGACLTFPNSIFIHKIGNANTGKLKDLTNLNKYLTQEKVKSGNSGGCSDITLYNKITDTFVFISSKYPKSSDEVKKQKSVDYYDIQNIIAICTKNELIYKKYMIYLVVPDKQKVLAKVKTANKSNEYITEHIKENNILDKNDLNKCFLAFKQDIIKNKELYEDINYNEIYLTTKDSLKLRFHQELITRKTSNLIEDGNKSFLWGCKCRSGKTYMSGGIIIKQLEVKKKLNVLIITPAPTETAPQFTEDLFNKFKDFNSFKIHHIVSSESIKIVKLENNNIFVMSKQLLQKYINKETIVQIKNLKLDIIIFDENHFSGTTDLSKDILNSYSSKNTVKIYLTATYNKPLKEWTIAKECQMFWDIEDEQICKSILLDETNINKLKEKHDDISVSNTIKYYMNLGNSIIDIFKSYENMPDLHLITNMFDSQRYEIIKEKLNTENKMGFCFNTLFGLNKKKTQFSFQNEVETVLRYISGSNKEEDGEKTIFTRIHKICSEKETRSCFTQIWFLPPDNIREISQCLTTLMNNNSILKQYDILSINSKNKELAKDIKDEINKKELEAIGKGKRGLILLAGNMLTLGITLNRCDIVILMNNTLSSDKVLQQIYRCMTEGVDKKIGFVIDLNISRVLNTCVSYTLYKNNIDIEEKMKFLITNHLINIDIDMMENKKINTDTIVKKLMAIWKEDPVNSFKILLKKLDNDYEEFDNSTQKQINKTFSELHKGNTINATLALKDEEDDIQELPTGQEKVKNENDSNDKDITDKDKKDDAKEIQISFTKDVLPYIIPLVCILTVKDSNLDFVKMLNDIKDNKDLLDIFDDQCLIWWNKKDLINFIKDIVNKFFDKNSNTFNISIQFKMSLRSLIDTPKELLELITDCLKPKDIEKKKFGEVFTPMSLINNMLDKLPKEVWTNKDLKWLDPAAGMGNFPIAVYLRLVNSLKNIKDIKKRKKHILENMLYMSELNKKNVLIYKQIFDINSEYKLNIYEGDSLTLDTKKIFKVDKFDIIIGNPPYNKAFTKAGATPIYNEFVEKFIDKCTYLIFITPSRWFSGGKGLDKFRKFMLTRKDIVSITHFDDASKIFGNKVDIKGGVNYFLKNSTYNSNSCEFNGSMMRLNKYDVFVDNKYYSIIDKLIRYPSINSMYNGRCYGIESNDKRLVLENKNNKLLSCYVSKQKGFVKYIDKKEISKDYNFYKVITTEAAFEHKSSFGNTFIGTDKEVHSGSYISFKMNNKQEAESLLSYMHCKLPNVMLSLRKSSQHINNSVCEWIPLPSLDKKWTDDAIYAYFKLTQNEIVLINNTIVHGYKSIKQLLPIVIVEEKVDNITEDL